MKASESDYSIWLTNDLPKDIQTAMKNAAKLNREDPKVKSAMMQMAAKGLFPVKTVIKSAGEIAMSTELIKIEQKKLEDKTFSRPSGVEFKPMPAGMMGGQN
jgi:hypothetical protein